MNLNKQPESNLNKRPVHLMNLPGKNSKGHNSLIRYSLPAVVLLLTWWCYKYSLNNEFTNWDDDRFVTQNIFIKSLSSENLKMVLLHDVKVDNYIPVTVISFALNYHFSGLNPQTYFLCNILIHLLNSCLIFIFSYLLLSGMEKQGYGIFKRKYVLAFFCSMAFAIHPMHVESVSWMAERKDLLYAFFYFAGLITYLKYVETENEINGEDNKHRSFITLWVYLLVLLFFMLSVLSKPMAVVFPFSLLGMDILLKRGKKISWKKILLEKTPFVIISVLIAIITYHFQESAGAVQENEAYGIFQRLLFSSYGFNMYLWKAFIPISQSSFYPFPATPGTSGMLPVIFYLSPLFSLIIILMPLYLSYRYFSGRNSVKNNKGNNSLRILIFGLGFYFFNMIIVSQIIGVGHTIIADRYTYVCYFGIFFPITVFMNDIMLNKNRPIILTALAGIILYMFFLASLCRQRTHVWHNTETLWTDVIRQYPGRIATAYNDLGLYYFSTRFDPEKAYENYLEAINLGTKDPNTYCNMGLLMDNKNQYNSALEYYSVALKKDSNFSVVYMDRGIVYAKMGQYAFALNDFRHCLRLKHNSETLLQNMAFTFLKAQIYDSAIVYYNGLIQNNPNLYGYFHCRGVAEYYSGKIIPAINDFKENLRLSPRDSAGMYYLSMAFTRNNDFKDAYIYAQMAQLGHYLLPGDYINSLKQKLNIK